MKVRELVTYLQGLNQDLTVKIAMDKPHEGKIKSVQVGTNIYICNYISMREEENV